ncbi:MAG: acyltransferase [Lachnospiraceae bacterium]|nr:acyltransferase [Lachnospiraceae bacterium]
MSGNPAKKEAFYEFLRVLAIILVVLNHLPIATAFMVEEGLGGGLYLLFAIIVRVNVPIFFMISGALLLRKDEDLKTVLHKRVLRFALILFVFSLGLYLADMTVSLLKYGYTEASVWDFIWKFTGNSVPGADSYWFLYSYLALLCFLPFLKRIVEKITKYEFIAILIMHFIIASLIPVINLGAVYAGAEDIGWPSRLQLPLVTVKPFFYAVCGYYLDTKADISQLKGKQKAELTAACLLAIILSFICVKLDGDLNGYSEKYIALFDYVLAISIFLLVRKLFSAGKPDAGGRDIIPALGSLSFGIYLLDPFLKAALYSKYTGMCADRLNFAVFSLGWLMISLILGGVLTSVLKKLPLMNKLF